MRNFVKNQTGITLIALVVTIIVLIILAGVSIAMIVGENGIITQAQRAAQETEQAKRDEEAGLSSLETAIQEALGNVYNEEAGVNVPKLTEGMIPVYYDENTKSWKKADKNNENNQWYDYDAKKWANIVTVSDENAALREAEVGTEIPVEDITTFFVWIPRYAYSITSGYEQGEGASGKIDVTFLKGNTNTGSDGVNYATDYDESELSAGDITPKIVHPGFTLGNTQLTGIWVAKFEASGTNASDQAVGNTSSSSSIVVAPDDTTYVKILPSKISWRHITIGESEYQSIYMSNNTAKYGWSSSVNSHLMKNREWGAVAYLCYSDYGSIPMTNGAGSYNSSENYFYDVYTGAGPKSVTGDDSERRYDTFNEDTNGYNTTLGVLASTTGNVYGIYDMAGGANERVAGYFDNENGNLNTNGKSTSNESVKYFENGELKSEYTNLWDCYEVSEEEKSNQIQVGDNKISQETLWSWSNKEIEYNEARKRLAEGNFNLMATHKGIGVNETTTIFSYYAPYGTTSGVYGWFQEVKDTSRVISQDPYARTWNDDYTLIGYASVPFTVRGGNCNDVTGAGVLFSNLTDGSALHSNGFRPVLAF